MAAAKRLDTCCFARIIRYDRITAPGKAGRHMGTGAAAVFGFNGIIKRNKSFATAVCSVFVNLGGCNVVSFNRFTDLGAQVVL